MAVYFFRLVADYGYGDKSWVETYLTAAQMVEELERRDLISEDSALQLLEKGQAAIEDWLIWEFNNWIYSVEVHHPGDKEDWDWMDS